MSLQPLPGFRHFPTHHCVTGSMRHMYAFNQHDMSEDLLLGLGSGVGFIYWHTKGQAPFLGGRGMPKPSMEQLAGKHTGVIIIPHATSSPRVARQSLLDILASGQPVMLQVDMGYLPYFDFHGTEYHFGGHAIIVCGYDPNTNQVLVADREEPLHSVPMADLEKARSSMYKPFPPHNRWYTYDFSQKRQPTPLEVRRVIAEQAESMLKPPISNFGVAGIRKAAHMLPTWHEKMGTAEVHWALFNTYIFVSPVGGSGGGLFRHMFSRFLGEAADITSNKHFAKYADDFKQVADQWAAFGEWCRLASENYSDNRILEQGSSMLLEIASEEETAWNGLVEIV